MITDKKQRSKRKRKHRKFQEQYKAKNLENYESAFKNQEDSDDQMIELEMNDVVDQIADYK